MTGYYGMFLLYVFLGLLFSGALFYWAVANGQFREQDRARYLALSCEEREPRGPATTRWPRSMILVVLVIGSAVAVPLGLLLIRVFTS